MKLNNIKHVFFDLDHTLWDFDRNSGLAFEKIFELNEIDIEICSFLEKYEPINLSYWKLYREEKIDKKSLRYRRLKDTFNAVNLEVNDDLINKLSVDYIDHLSTYNHLFDGTREILEYLCQNYRLHIITNGFQEAQNRKIASAKIESYFTTITNSEMVGVKKPNLKIFNYALSKAGAIPKESIMIGDNYEADVLGALNAKLDAIHFNYLKIVPIDNIKTIESLEQIKNYL